MKRVILIVGLALLSLSLVIGCGKQEEPAKIQKSVADQKAAPAEKAGDDRELRAQEQVKKEPAHPPGTIPAEELADFGVSGIEVRSLKSRDTTMINTEVSQAAGKGEKWPKEAVLVTLKLVGEGLKGSTKIIEVRTPPESQETATITVNESGYLDDASSGERWRLWLAKGADGTWSIKRALWAQLCDRPGSRFYSAEKCP